jgi:hypothetical protein
MQSCAVALTPVALGPNDRCTAHSKCRLQVVGKIIYLRRSYPLGPRRSSLCHLEQYHDLTTEQVRAMAGYLRLVSISGPVIKAQPCTTTGSVRQDYRGVDFLF